MNENQTPVILTVIGVAAILFIAGLFMTASINSNLTALASGIEMPTAEAIGAVVLAGITMPDMPEYDTEKLDRVCELTDGCEYWDINDSDKPGDLTSDAVLLILNDSEAWEDFAEQFGDLIDLDFDDDEFTFENVSLWLQNVDEDVQIRASDEDAEDDNWEVKIFLRVQYRDTDLHYDSDEVDVEYVVVTSVLDEGDYDSLSIEEVSRRFEFN